MPHTGEGCLSSIHVILSASKEPGRFLLRFRPFSKEGIDILRTRWPRGDERYWDDEGKGWSIELVHLVKIRELFDAAGTMEYGDEIAKLFNSQRKQDKPVAIDVVDYKFKTKPFEHQRRGFHLARRAKAFGLLMEMGCGKTKTLIDVLSYHLMEGNIDGAIIVCPKSVLYTWEKEIETHSPLPPEKRRVVVIAGQKADKLQALEIGGQTAQFIIIGYDAVRDYEEHLVRIMKRRRMAMGLDESTRIKNAQSRRTKACHRLRKLAVLRFILTGSPVGNLPLDAWAQFYFLDPDILGHASFTSCKAEYARVLVKPGHQLSGILIIGYKNLERMNERIKPHSFRVLKKECLDLPEKIYHEIELVMSAQQADYYNQMKEQSIIELTGLKNKCDCPGTAHPASDATEHAVNCMSLRPVVLAAPHVLTRTTRLAQLTGGFYPVLGPDNKPTHIELFPENPKLDAVMEILEEAQESNKKSIIWCRFTPEIDMFCKALGEAKIGTVVLTGATDEKERALRIGAFQELDEVRVFLGQIAAGGVGITLTAAQKVLYYSNSLSLEDRLQSEDRAHRIGQKNDVDYYDFSYRHTVDMAIRKALREKKNFADIVTGDNLRRAYEGVL